MTFMSAENFNYGAGQFFSRRSTRFRFIVSEADVAGGVRVRFKAAHVRRKKRCFGGQCSGWKARGTVCIAALRSSFRAPQFDTETRLSAGTLSHWRMQV